MQRRSWSQRYEVAWHNLDLFLQSLLLTEGGFRVLSNLQVRRRIRWHGGGAKEWPGGAQARGPGRWDAWPAGMTAESSEIQSVSTRSGKV